MCYKYANYLVRRYNEINEADNIRMKNKRLQKLLYYAFARYAFITNGKQLFGDKFYAWEYGPVIPEVYYSYSAFQCNDMVPITKGTEKLTKKEIEVLEYVLEQTQNRNVDFLIERTHKGLPYKNHINTKMNLIPSQEIAAYYKKKENFIELFGN